MFFNRGSSPTIDHVSVGVRNVAVAKCFYDAALKPLGYSCLNEGADSLGYGSDAVAFWINAAERPVPADDKSGLHVCFAAPTRTSVDAFHAAALRAGGRDNGRPGLRSDYGADYYAAFVVDPDGYRIEAYLTSPDDRPWRIEEGEGCPCVKKGLTFSPNPLGRRASTLY
jgi:catechol 2,3-dioxygenase-like lactoylglutathione lyase family enzyme